MARQISSKRVENSMQSAGRTPPTGRLPAVRWVWFALLAVIVFTAFPNLKAESLASKNRKGNRLFAQGKYEDAEKAYLDAQVNNPGRPEILYNLGNSLIKQKKYDQGIQALRQSTGKGDKKIRENSWYNSGNALFSMGKFKDSAEAFIQALRLDPADRDAKHNLELALMKLKQQEQKQANTRQNQKESENRKQDRSRTGKEDQRQSIRKGQNGPGNHRQQDDPGQPKSAQTVPNEGSISKEQALQILDALQSHDLGEQRRLMERRARLSSKVKDW